MPHIDLRIGLPNAGCWTAVRTALLRAALLLALPLAAGLAIRPAGAQTSPGEIQVLIPALIQIQTSAESPLPIRVDPRASVPRRAMILIRGLPTTIALSHGRLFESGVWGIPVAEIGDLHIASPTGTVGRTDFSVSVVTLTGDVLAEAKSSLVIGQDQIEARPEPPVQLRSRGETATAYVAPVEPAQPEPPAPAVAESSTAPPVKGPPTGEALDRVMLYMQKGDESLNTGNLNVARLFYKRAADEGWGEGALSLGATYDPAELSRMRIAGGIQSDPAQARKWYELAAQLGSKLAQTRLQRLSQR